jgi:hypothetical protein
VVIGELKHWFSRFLRRRRPLQHFGRHSLVDALAAHGPSQAVPADLAKSLMQVALEDTALRCHMGQPHVGMGHSDQRGADVGHARKGAAQPTPRS